MTWKPAFTLVLAVALALGTVAPNARADAATEAQLQYELGAEHYKQGRYPEALERFIASHRLVPNPNVVLNIVQTFAFLQRNEEAYNWNETLIEASKDDGQRNEAISRRAQLAKKVAVVDVTTTPPGAELFVDRVELGSVGRSPRRIAVKAGDHQIIARLDRHDEANSQARVTVGSSVTVALALKPTLGTVRVSSTPAGANVVDEATGSVLGRTPVELQLPVGEHRLELALPGWVSQTKTVTSSKTAAANVDVTLQRAASSVTVLSVRGNVDGATVSLNGSPIGRAPLSLESLGPGVALLEVSAPGREPWGQRISLENGTATRVTYDLVDPDTKPWSGWRWLGYGTGGALLAAGAVVGLMAVSARDDFDKNPSSAGMDEVKSKNTTADILMGAGVLVVGATLTWDILRAPPPESRGSVSMDR